MRHCFSIHQQMALLSYVFPPWAYRELGSFAWWCMNEFRVTCQVICQFEIVLTNPGAEGTRFRSDSTAKAITVPEHHLSERTA